MKEFNPLISRLSEVVTYDPVTGDVVQIRNQRKLFPDHQGYLTIWFSTPKKQLLKIKADKVACYLGAGKLVDTNYKVLHKNLNTEDNRLCNLSIVPKEQYLEVIAAVRNMQGDLMMKPHPSDQFVYFVYYREGKRIKRELCLDIIAAQDLIKEQELIAAKLIGQYVNSNI